MGEAAQSGLEAMNSAETNLKEWGLGKPCAGNRLHGLTRGRAASRATVTLLSLLY